MVQNREDTGWFGDDSNLRNFRNKVKLNTSSYDMLIYSPVSGLAGEGEVVTVKINPAFNDMIRGIHGDFVLHEGEIRPGLGGCQVGSAGKFTVEWIGNYEGSQSINAVCEERRPNGSARDFVWDISLSVSQF